LSWLPLNLDLIKNPYNWLVVGIMVLILALSLHLIFGADVTPDAT
jgi:hypothetical protein